MMFFTYTTDTLKEFLNILCAGLAREEKLLDTSSINEFPIVLNVGDTLVYRGVSLECKKARLLRNEKELQAYVRPYLLLRSMKG